MKIRNAVAAVAISVALIGAAMFQQPIGPIDVICWLDPCKTKCANKPSYCELR